MSPAVDSAPEPQKQPTPDKVQKLAGDIKNAGLHFDDLSSLRAHLEKSKVLVTDEEGRQIVRLLREDKK